SFGPMAAPAGPWLTAVRANEPAVARNWRRVMDMDFPPTRLIYFLIVRRAAARVNCRRPQSWWAILVAAPRPLGPSKGVTAPCPALSGLCQKLPRGDAATRMLNF